jgi:hypothetical protein
VKVAIWRAEVSHLGEWPRHSTVIALDSNNRRARGLAKYLNLVD